MRRSGKERPINPIRNSKEIIGIINIMKKGIMI
jgi:hypothetical protein